MLTNQLAVLKFTVQNTATSQDITGSVRQLTVKHGTDVYYVTPATSQSTYWVAVKPIAVGSGNIDIYAAVGKDLYKKSVSSYGALAACGCFFFIGTVRNLSPTVVGVGR